MGQDAPADVADVVARFFERRCSGERLSIDDVLGTFPDLSNRSATRVQALRQIARQASASAVGQSESAGVAALHPPYGELPTLAGYDIVDCIGRGGMGIVYEAYQQSTGRRVAIKFLLDAAASTEAARRRFEREVELVARLDHPHIVSVLDSGVEQGRYFYAMDYVEGRPLDEAHAPGQNDVHQTLRLIATICEAVDYAHQRGVLHRDLKPSNVLIDERGRPHLLDFGLAKAIGPGSRDGMEVTLSEPGQIIGTLSYMPPEQSRGQFEQMSVRSDVYSLGAMSYELITGSLACDVDGPLAEVLERIANEDPVLPSRLRHKLSADLDAVLLKALAKDPKRRYESAAALADDIDRYLTGRPVAARRQSRIYVLRKTISRHRGWFAVGGLLLAALIVVAGAASIVATQRQTVIATLEAQAQQRETRLATLDARRAALTYYYQAVDLIRRRVRRDDARTLLNRALEIDPTFSAAYLERGVLRALDNVFISPCRRVETVAALHEALSDFDQAHEYAGGDWLVDPESGARLTPAEARALATDDEHRLVSFPDVLRLDDGLLARLEPDGRRIPVGGPGLPRALMAAGNLLATRVRQLPAGDWMDAIVTEEMDRYYRRAAALDPTDIYTRLSRALAASAKPSEQPRAARLLEVLLNDEEATVLVEFWQAVAEVRLGGPRRRYAETHPQRDSVAAERAARQVTMLARNDVYGWYLLGLALQGQGRYADAIDANERALTTWREALSGSGADYARPFSQEDPFSGPILTNLATCHALLGDFERAWPLYEQALDKSGGSLLVLLERAEAYHLAGMTPQARADLDHAKHEMLVDHAPFPGLALPAVWALLTFPDSESHDPHSARQIIAEIRKRELFRNDATVLTLLSYALVESGEPTAGLELLAQLPSTGDLSPFQDAVLAAALHAVGRTEEADRHFRRAESAARGLRYPDPRLTRLLEQIHLVAAP